MFCIHCGAANPDDALFCPNCGRKQASVALPNQPLEIPALVTSPEQPSFVEQPNLQQPTISGPALPISGNQLWEEFGTGSSSDQKHLPYHEMSSQIPPMPATQPNLPIESTGPVTPIPPVRSPWTRILEPRFGRLAKPLPLWATLPVIALVILGLVALQLTGSDWAAGTLHVAIATSIIGILVALAAGVRALAGQRKLKRFIGPGLAVLLLLITSLAGFTQQSTVHRLQASSLEGQKQWQRAITEFQLAGEGAPTSVNIARTYVEWGEQLSSQQQHSDAGLKFDTVTQTYSSATAEVARAQSDKITDLLTWGKQAINQQNYSAATLTLDGLLKLNYCLSVCQEQGSALDATAYYNLAKSELASQQYNNATRDFQTVLTRFNGSPEAHQLHPDLAQSILGQGQQQLASDCSSAIPTYQQLSTDFADTPAGQQAIKALHARQPVTGHFITAIPNDPSLTPTVILAKNLYGGIPHDQEGQAINGAPTVKIESNGNFSFKPMQQGTYDLVWGSIRSDGAESFTFFYDRVTQAPIYVATVGPLCPFSFGDINESIPTPS